SGGLGSVRKRETQRAKGARAQRRPLYSLGFASLRPLPFAFIRLGIFVMKRSRILGPPCPSNSAAEMKQRRTNDDKSVCRRSRNPRSRHHRHSACATGG